MFTRRQMLFLLAVANSDFLIQVIQAISSTSGSSKAFTSSTSGDHRISTASTSGFQLESVADDSLELADIAVFGLIGFLLMALGCLVTMLVFLCCVLCCSRTKGTEATSQLLLDQDFNQIPPSMYTFDNESSIHCVELPSDCVLTIENENNYVERLSGAIERRIAYVNVHGKLLTADFVASQNSKDFTIRKLNYNERIGAYYFEARHGENIVTIHLCNVVSSNSHRLSV